MELGGREILVGLGVLLVIAILLDGFRRSRGRGAGKLRVSRRKQPIFDDDDFDEASNRELPGKARVVEVRDEQSAEQLSRVLKQNAARNHSKLTTPFREPEQELLGLESEFPPFAGESDYSELNESGFEDSGDYKFKQSEFKQNATKQEATEQDVIVLHVMAGPEQQFGGADLLEVALKSGLRYGAQKIFHHHKNADGTGDVLFSMTNSVNPGTFELNEMADFSTPGVSFFMIMQDSDDPMSAFEQLLSTVDTIKDALGGELKDESRSALTRQTAEHLRARIMDYNRRQLAG